MHFKIIGIIDSVETFATGSTIREIARLHKTYGKGRWPKRKGNATIQLANGVTCEAESIGMKQPASVAGNSRSRTSFEFDMARPTSRQFMICIDNAAYPASLEKRKIYISPRDIEMEKNGLVRIIDESGEDYLYPKSLFRLVTLPDSLKKAVLAA